MCHALQADTPGNLREGISVWSQSSESQKQKPQATRLTRMPGRTNHTINVTGGTEFEKCIASTTHEKKLRKTFPAIADMGLNAPKRKEQKKQLEICVLLYEEN